ncbi:hypothetical protein Tco_0632064, partial [Tanacetum coccineum]
QPLPAAISHTTQLPGYVLESDPEEDPEEDDEDPEEYPADYPTDRDDDTMRTLRMILPIILLTEEMMAMMRMSHLMMMRMR